MAAIVNEKEMSDFSEDPNNTVLIVDPEHRLKASAATPAPPLARPVPARAMQLPGCGLNPLVRAANPLLERVLPLRYMAAPADLGTLRLQLVGAIRQFEAEAKSENVEHEIIAAARYALCTVLDETISSTRWGRGGVWSSNSLLVVFHNEASGGEKFFLILQRLAQNPERNLDVLELMYLCLALGLEGRYAVLDGGQAQLATLRERLLQLIQSRRGSFDPDLSPHWQGVQGKRTALSPQLPIWIALGLTICGLLVLQICFSFNLDRRSISVLEQLQEIQLKRAVPATPSVPVAVKPTQRIPALFAPEIEHGLISVSETADRSTVTLRGDGAFATGSTKVGSQFVALLGRIGDALKMTPGKVIVVGHTDNVGGKISGRFSSNWVLSKERANAVLSLLTANGGADERFTAEGVGDTEPLVANDSPANRARNRRVEIIVLHSVAPQ